MDQNEEKRNICAKDESRADVTERKINCDFIVKWKIIVVRIVFAVMRFKKKIKALKYASCHSKPTGDDSQRVEPS